MIFILLVIHLMIAIALVAVILLQRSEGGALGIGGGGAGGFMTARGAANILTRATAILAAAFLGTSILLAIMSGGEEDRSDLIEVLDEDPVPPSVFDQPFPELPPQEAGDAEDDGVPVVPTPD